VDHRRKEKFAELQQFSLESAFGITRKLQFTRNTNSTPWQYASNQMYFMGITNDYGIQCWNSYVPIIKAGGASWPG